jgi:hypothetical protein
MDEETEFFLFSSLITNIKNTGPVTEVRFQSQDSFGLPQIGGVGDIKEKSQVTSNICI